tara:strand:+ start:427 stop:876 length:450 start_codon:yes stop_codon:yes gene_type:complete
MAPRMGKKLPPSLKKTKQTGKRKQPRMVPGGKLGATPKAQKSTAQIRRLTVDGKSITDAPFVPDIRKGKFKNIEIGMKDMPAGYNEGGKVIGKKKVIIGSNSNLTDEELDRYIQQLREPLVVKPVKKNRGGVVRGFSPIARPQRFKGVF